MPPSPCSPSVLMLRWPPHGPRPLHWVSFCHLPLQCPPPRLGHRHGAGPLESCLRGEPPPGTPAAPAAPHCPPPQPWDFLPDLSAARLLDTCFSPVACLDGKVQFCSPHTCVFVSRNCLASSWGSLDNDCVNKRREGP